MMKSLAMIMTTMTMSGIVGIQILLSTLLVTSCATLLYVVYRRRLQHKNSALYKLLEQLQHKEADSTSMSRDRIFDDELSHQEVVYRDLCKLMREEELFKFPINVDNLAQCLGTTARKLNSAVAHYNGGGGINDFINRYRLHHAITLLSQHPSLSAATAGKEAGFASPEVYQQLFTQHFGMSPTEYQNLSRNKRLEKPRRPSFSKQLLSVVPHFFVRNKNLF